MRRECCVCKVSLGPDIPDPDGWDYETHGKPVSSGYCPQHLAELLRSLDLARAAETTDPGTDPGNW